MSIISEVKCARCDRKYSGVRSRCPYCGARRIGSGKYSEEGDNSKGKMIIGILIMAVLVVAAGVLLFTAPNSNEAAATPPTVPETPETVDMPDELQNTSMEGIGPSVSPSDDPEEDEDETPSPEPQTVQSITITYAGYYIDDFTEPVGTKIPLKVRVEPVSMELEEPIIWTSSDTSVFAVVTDNTEGTSALVTIIGSGSQKSATLTVSVGGVKAECIVRVGK